jgi:hypothetical protein
MKSSGGSEITAKNLQAGARGNVGLGHVVGRIRRAALQHEAPIAIAAIDIAMFVNLQKDARMAKGCGNTMARAVTGDSAGMDAKNLWRCLHVARLASTSRPGNIDARRSLSISTIGVRAFASRIPSRYRPRLNRAGAPAVDMTSNPRSSVPLPQVFHVRSRSSHARFRHGRQA